MYIIHSIYFYFPRKLFEILIIAEKKIVKSVFPLLVLHFCT